jgi:hypothetical protein
MRCRGSAGPLPPIPSHPSLVLLCLLPFLLVGLLDLYHIFIDLYRSDRLVHMSLHFCCPCSLFRVLFYIQGSPIIHRFEQNLCTYWEKVSGAVELRLLI